MAWGRFTGYVGPLVDLLPVRRLPPFIANTVYLGEDRFLLAAGVEAIGLPAMMTALAAADPSGAGAP